MFEEKDLWKSYLEFKKFPSLDPPEAFMRTLEEIDEEKVRQAEEDYWQRKYEDMLYEYIY